MRDLELFGLVKFVSHCWPEGLIWRDDSKCFCFYGNTLGGEYCYIKLPTYLAVLVLEASLSNHINNDFVVKTSDDKFTLASYPIQDEKKHNTKLEALVAALMG